MTTTIAVLIGIEIFILFFRKGLKVNLPWTWDVFIISVIGFNFARPLVELSLFYQRLSLAIIVITGLIVFFARSRVKRAGRTIFIMVALLFAILVYNYAYNNTDAKLTPEVEEPVEIVEVTDAEPTEIVEVTDDATIVEKAHKIMLDAGWESSDYVVEAVDISKDKSTAGASSFATGNIQSPAQMISFIESDTDASNAMVDEIMKETGATRNEIFDISNWVAIQALKDFSYPGNTGYEKGGVVSFGERTGDNGDIFLLFISPSTDKFMFVRGACANPQYQPPTKVIYIDRPVEKIVEVEVEKIVEVETIKEVVYTIVEEVEVPVIEYKTKWKTKEVEVEVPVYIYVTEEGKSSDPDDYKHVEDKPLVPEVTTPAEDSPPEVDSSVDGTSGVRDEPSNDAGTETGVTAPEATESVDDRTETVPDEEDGVNPEDGSNTGDPGLPAGF